MNDHTTNELTNEIPYGYCQCGCGQPAPLAKNTSKRQRTVKGEPVRFIVGHQGRRPPTDRFWEKVKVGGPDDCWEWTAASDRHGYGYFYDGHRLVGAHRFAYALTHGPVGENLEVCHQCDNPPCCNPAHLFEGSRLDNIRDMNNKNRGSRPVYQGEDHPRTHLVDEDIREIRRLVADGSTRRVIAAMFGIHPATIGDITKRRSWKHID